MTRYVLLSLLLVALVLIVQAAQVEEKVDVRHTKATGYYPADTLNLVTLGLVNGKKYLFVDQNITWFEASYFCNAYGMDLVSIETQNENDLIMEQIVTLGLDKSTGLWTAAHKIGRSTWLWLSGENMIFSDWAPGNPANPPDDNCMIIFRSDWYDARCNIDSNGYEKRGFVCEDRLAE